eukprot:TRINITY_DN2938_c1_g11_i1.p1 TRINITY_DN2938_c1_g11~~TRINITY_DN2938_c1_g11_i1.p1  ORF type:complete len:977 (+),score=233.24 TRINITY_DN2938_c1_g11_i1:83-3013(+)
MPLQKSLSLPTLSSNSRSQKPSPYNVELHLYHAEVANRRLLHHSIDAGTVRRKAPVRLPFMASERGIEWERQDVQAKVRPTKLPPLEEVLKNALMEFDLDLDGGSPKTGSETLSRQLSSSRNPAFGGCEPFKGAHRLPIKRELHEVKEIAEIVGKGRCLSRSSPTAKPAGKKKTKAKATAKTKTAQGSAKVKVKFVEPEKKKASKERVRPAKDESSSDEDESSEGSSSSSSSSSGEEPPKVQQVEEPPEPELSDDPADIPFPWSDEEMRSIFSKFDVDSDGEVQTEELETMLKYMGGRPLPGDVEKITSSLTRFSSVSYEEFTDFLHKFRDIEVVRVKKDFDDADKNKNGSLDLSECQDMLTAMGFNVSPETTLEAIEEVTGVKGTARIRFRTFEALREHLRRTEGLNAADVAELRDIFTRAANAAIMKAQAKDGKKRKPMMQSLGGEEEQELELPINDFSRIVAFLGYPTSRETVEQLAAGVDADGSGLINYPELLKAIRYLRDQEQADIGKVFERYADDAEKKRLHLEKLFDACTKMDYLPSEDVIFQIVDEMGGLKHGEYMMPQEMSKFLSLYRRCNGLTHDEVADLTNAFEAQCKIIHNRLLLLDELNQQRQGPTPQTPKTPTGRLLRPAVPEPTALDALDANRILRNWGFAMSVQEVQAYTDVIDMDGSGQLEIEEFLKIMYRLIREESYRRQKIFTHLDSSRRGAVPATRLEEAVKMLVGTAPSPEMCEKAANQAGFSLVPDPRKPTTVNRHGFELFFRYYRKQSVIELVENACYNEKEVAHLQEVFNKYDDNGNGTVEGKEMQAMIAEKFPEATKSKEAQKEVVLALKEVDSQGNKELVFKDFLKLMRKCDDARDEADVKDEERAVKELKFANEEVEGYRQIFLQYQNMSGELELHNLHDILSKVVDFTPEEADELAFLVREVHPDRRHVVRFPHFLHLMKRMTEDNYGHVNQASARVLRKAQRSGGSK